MHTIFIVEDDITIRTELTTSLERNGLKVVSCSTFEHVVQNILDAAPDLVLLDLNLPGVDGHYICRSLREKSSVPVIVVTSRESEMDELLSMNFGADDFITKPYNLQILIARIASVLKRAQGNDAAGVMVYEGLKLESARCCVSYGNETVELTKNELRILTLLMQHAEKVVSRRAIQDELWQSNEFVDDNTLTVNVSHLRTTLGKIGADDFVHTKRGIGYVLERRP